MLAFGCNSSSSSDWIGPWTVPFTITWAARTLPTTRAFSLMTRMLCASPAATTSPCTSPSMRSPSVKRNSPVMTVPSPIRVRIGGCLLLLNIVAPHAGRMQSAGPSDFGGLGCLDPAARVQHPDLQARHDGLGRMLDRSFDTQILAHLQRLGALGRRVRPWLAVQSAGQRDFIPSVEFRRRLARLHDEQLEA